MERLLMDEVHAAARGGMPCTGNVNPFIAARAPFCFLPRLY